jgi:thioredoxin-like negative regulator of GroEL
LRLRQDLRLRTLAAERLFDGLVPAGRPAVVGFSLPMCHECHTLQAPAMERLESMMGESVSVRTVDVRSHSALAQRLGILTVPATVVLDTDGKVRFLNHGFAGEERLAEELSTVA